MNLATEIMNKLCANLSQEETVAEIMKLLPPQTDGFEVANDDMRMAIQFKVMPAVMALWLEKNKDYAGQFVFLGKRAQFCDINRKFWKLKRAMWDDEPMLFEDTEQVLMDMIGHCLQAIYMNNQAKWDRWPCGPTGDEMFCACGCGGDDSRCGYWLSRYAEAQEVDDAHTCCKVNRG